MCSAKCKAYVNSSNETAYCLYVSRHGDGANQSVYTWLAIEHAEFILRSKLFEKLNKISVTKKFRAYVVIKIVLSL
jgi:hypothetical protein